MENQTEEELGLVQKPKISLTEYFQDEFAPYGAKLEEWKKKADLIQVSSVDDIEAMAMAKTLEKFVGKALSSLEKKRKELKSESLEIGRAIDSAAKKFKEILEPLREDLKAKAEFKERLEAQERERVHNFRRNALIQYGIIITPEITVMSNEEFDEALADAKISYEKEIKQQKINKNRLSVLISEKVAGLISAQDASALSSLSDEEFKSLQSELKAKFQQQENERLEFERVRELYQSRVKLIQSLNISKFVELQNINSASDESFSAMVEVAKQRLLEEQTAIQEQQNRNRLNEERLSELTRASKIPEHIDTTTLYALSDDEFSFLKNNLAKSYAMQDRFDRGSDLKNIEDYIQWLKSEAPTPEVSSERGKEIVNKIKLMYGRMIAVLEEEKIRL